MYMKVDDYNTWILYFFATAILEKKFLVHYKLHKTAMKIKQNVNSDQSSLSFRVGHCHRQSLGMNMYINLT